MNRIVFSMEYVWFSIILALIVPFSFLFARGGNYIFSLPIVLVSFLYLAAYRKRCKTTLVRSIMSCFLVMTLFTSIGFFYYDLQYTIYPYFLTNAIIPFVIFLVFFNYSSRNKSEALLVLFFCLYYAMGLYYINYQQTIREGLFQMNNFYFVITPLPFLFLIEKPWIRSLFLVVSTFCVVVSLKRSGLVVVVLLLLYTAYYYFFTTKSFKKTVIFLALFAVMATVAVRYMQSLDMEYYDQMLTRLERTQEDGGSGREDLLKEADVMIKDMNPIFWIIGKGYSACDSEEPEPTGYHSFHNDYAEVMYSYGIIGLSMLICFIYHLIKKSLFAKKSNSKYRFSVASSLIIFLVFSFTSSVFYYRFYMLPLFMFWGYIEPKLEGKKIKDLSLSTQ